MRAGAHVVATALSLIAVFAIEACQGQAPATPQPSSSGQAQSVAPTSSAASSGPTPTATSAQSPAGFEFPIVGPDGTPPPADTRPTASELILADEQSGAITDDDALLYRVYAMFGDTRLPAAYASAAAGEDTAALGLAAQALADGTLHDDVKDEIAPFLARPDDPSSVLHGASQVAGGNAHAMAATYVAQDAPVCGPYDWAYVSSKTQPVKVWAPCNNPRLELVLPDALQAAETLYGEESQLMGPAIFDNGAPVGVNGYRAGADTKIDIYLSDTCITRGGSCIVPSSAWAGFAVPAEPFVQPPAGKSSGFVVIANRYAESLEALWSVTAHELFHVLEFAHLLNGYTESGKSHWFVEASAKWAEEHFVADGRPQWVYPYFGAFQNAKVGLGEVNGSNEYASFVWPYFMEQKAEAGSIAAAWRAMEGKNGWDEVNGAIDSAFSYGVNFRDFAVQALNNELPGNPTAPNLQAPDSSFPRWLPSPDKQPHSYRLEAGDEGDALTVPVDVPPLAMRYDGFAVGEGIAKIVINFGGVQPQQALDVDAVIKHKDGNWERRMLSPSETTFCLNRPEDDIQAFILVIADHGWKAADKLTGSYTVSPTDELCAETTYTMDLASKAGMRGAGHYEGNGQIECWHAADGTWSVSGWFVPERAPILAFTFSPHSMDVSVRDAPPEEGGLWLVDAQAQTGKTAGTIDITPKADGDPVQISAVGTSSDLRMSINATCTIVYEPGDGEPPF